LIFIYENRRDINNCVNYISSKEGNYEEIKTRYSYYWKLSRFEVEILVVPTFDA